MPIDTKLHEESCCYLLIICMKNALKKVKTDDILAARTICNLHSCYNFALVLSKNALRANQTRVTFSGMLLVL